MRRLVVRRDKRDGHVSHAMLITTPGPEDVPGLSGWPAAGARDPELSCRAYAQLYDRRGGAVEIEIKEDKQGFGMGKRHKRKAEAQEMLVLLNVLAHDVLVWARSRLAEETPRLKRYGTSRFVRDLLTVSGVVEVDQRNRVRRIILNRAASLARSLLSALRRLLLREGVTIILDKI